MPRPIEYWWCNQTRCWGDERAAGVVSAGESHRADRFRSGVGDVRMGDVIVHYLSGSAQSVVAISRARDNGRRERIDLRRYNVARPKCEYGSGWIFKTKYYDLVPDIKIAPLRTRLAAIGP